MTKSLYSNPLIWGAIAAIIVSGMWTLHAFDDSKNPLLNNPFAAPAFAFFFVWALCNFRNSLRSKLSR